MNTNVAGIALEIDTDKGRAVAIVCDDNQVQAAV